MKTRSIARSLVCCMAAALAVASAGSHQAKADGVVTANPGLPPQGAIGGQAAYLAVNDVVYDYAGNIVVLSHVQHSAFTNISVSFSNGNEMETFNSVLSGLVSVNGTPEGPFSLSGPVSVLTLGRTSDSETGTFSTVMQSMDMTGTVGPYSVEIALNPNIPTTGSTTITGPVGGLYTITSFFDVFTELNVNNLGFVAANGGHMVVLQTVPEPSALVMGAIAATFGLAYAGSRRRRAT